MESRALSVAGPPDPAAHATKTDKVGNVLPAEYAPDRVEIVSRRLKLEYIGMASVFAAIWAVNFRDLPELWQSIVATFASFFLFLGMKKKTRDHLVTSFLMFAAAALALPAVMTWLWVVPLTLFASCAWAMEGYREKRRGRIVMLPAIFAGFAWTSVLWPSALLFVAPYLLEPRAEHPGLRRKLALLTAASSLAGVVVGSFRRGATIDAWKLHPPDPWVFLLLFTLAIPVALALVGYWKQLAAPHMILGSLFLALSPFDDRFVAMFGIVAGVILAATVFRQSVDSLRWRGAFKHAEWYYFWFIAAAAIYLVIRAPGS
jgi:hypothetical protein